MKKLIKMFRAMPLGLVVLLTVLCFWVGPNYHTDMLINTFPEIPVFVA